MSREEAKSLCKFCFKVVPWLGLIPSALGGTRDPGIATGYKSAILLIEF